VLQKLAAIQVGINLRYYGIDKKTEQTPWDSIVDQITTDYGKSKTSTVKNLLEIAQKSLSK
jgi:hypothetical protein